jgi:hypothetical protein
MLSTYILPQILTKSTSNYTTGPSHQHNASNKRVTLCRDNTACSLQCRHHSCTPSSKDYIIYINPMKCTWGSLCTIHITHCFLLHLLAYLSHHQGEQNTGWFKKMNSHFTQTAYLLKLVIPTTNALPRRMNVETTMKCTLHSSRWLSFNELTNAKKSCAA